MTKHKPTTPTILRQRFHRDKNVWRRQVLKAIDIADNISKTHTRGDYISMGVIYESARKIAKAGKRGVQLRHRMDDYAIVKRDRVHESIASACKLLEDISAVIQAIAEKQGTPLISFPVFVSELAVTSSIELASHDALQQLMGDVENG